MEASLLPIGLDLCQRKQIFKKTSFVTGNLSVIGALLQKVNLLSTDIYLVSLAISDIIVCVVGCLGRILPRGFFGMMFIIFILLSLKSKHNRRYM